MKKEELLKDKTNEQLLNLIEDEQADIFRMRNELAMTRKLEKPHLIRYKKKNIARANTLLSERKKNEAK